MYFETKTFMVDAKDLQVKYVVVSVWLRDPKINVLKRQAELAIEALARRVQTYRALKADVEKLFADHVQPKELSVTVL